MTEDTPTTILLIEDSPADVRLVDELLHQGSHDSFKLLTAPTLAHGLALLSANSVDAIVLDLGLSDSQGLDTLRAVHKQTPDLPIIVLTISEDDALGERALQEGAQRFLSKDALTLGASYAPIFVRMIRFAMEYKRADTECTASEKQLRTLFEDSPIFQIRYDPEGYPVMVNRAAREFLGIDDVTVIQHISIFTSPRVTDADKARLRAGKPTRYEQIYDFDAIKREGAFPTTKSGVRYVDFSLAPIFDKEGTLEAYLGQLVDITERKRAETALQDAHEEVKSLNEELQSATDELRVANEDLEARVQERTEELHETMEELSATNEELRVTNAELRNEVDHRTRLETVARHNAERTELLNRVITLANECADERTYIGALLDVFVNELEFDTASLYFRHGDFAELDDSRGLSEDVVAHQQRLSVNIRPLDSVYAGELHYDEAYEQGDAALISDDRFSLIVGIPLFEHARVFGNFTLGSTRTRQLSTSELQTLMAIGHEAGTVIARLQAEAAIRTQARHTTLLNKIILHANITSDAQDFLQYVCDVLTTDLGYDAVDMRVLCDTNDRVAEQIAVKGFPAEFNTRFRYMSVDDPILRAVYRGEPSFPERSTKTHEDLVHATGMASIGIVPFAVGETIVGDMGVALKDYRPFSPDEQALLISIGHETGTVLARLQAEEQVRAGSRYVRSLIEASLDPLVTISAEGMITDVNKATEEATGCSRDELVGSDFSDYFTEPEKARAGYKKAFTDGFVRDYPLTLRHKSGSVIDVLYNATVYRNEVGDVQGVFAAARDITDRKRAEEELQRYSSHLEDLVEKRTAQLKDSERLAAIGQTATMIGHDLRNPLQALQLLVDLAQKFYNDLSPEARAGFNAATADRIFLGVEKQIQYMDKIVSDLQDYARPLTVELETVQVAAFISDTLGLLTIPDSISVNISVVNSVPAKIDPHFMQRALSNLIMNAVQAMPQGGELTINAAAENHAVVITVHDTGEGVPENMKDTLFSPLTTGKAKGTGLGLAVVKRIVEAHGGTITFESEEGTGTTFTVTLPQFSD